MKNLEQVARSLKTPISLIVAVSQNNVIGKAGTMPWHIKGELGYFKRTTLGKPIIMGRKTFASLNKPLIDRANIVLTKNLNFHIEQNLPENTSLHFCTDLAQGLELADKLALNMSAAEIMIIGGGSVYAQILPFAEKIYLSRIAQYVEDGDTFFPQLDQMQWKLVQQQDYDEFEAQIWENKLLNQEEKFFTKKDNNLLDLTAKIDDKVARVINKMDEINKTNQELKDKITQQSIEETATKMDNTQTTEKPSAISSNSEKVSNLNKIASILKAWQEKYPNTFFEDDIKPLKVGIHEDLISVGDYPENIIKRALAQYTKRPKYLRSMLEGVARVDLTGATEVLVTKQNADEAKAALESIRKINKEKAKAKQPSKADASIPHKKNKKVSDVRGKSAKKYKNSDKRPVNKNSDKNGAKITDEQRFQNKLQKLLDKNRR